MQHKELLSAYIDGEEVSQEFTAKLCQDQDLQQSWHTLHLIRSVVRQESEIVLGDDFTAKMASLIEQETKVLDEQPTQPTVPIIKTLKRYFAPVLQLAVAASVCFVAIIGVQSLNQADRERNSADVPILQTLPFTRSVEEVSYNVADKNTPSREELEQQNRKINQMFQDYELQRRIYQK
ncbi:hypothetical protein CEP49_04985 [Mergibacter septicus]|uniref:sigma-E factor negative regulatory protein n=1 Tax=Mergibacter septicus TaxID=221402 RepID=UPI0011791CE0|nr:sigma-E factor negative regulatory protein [Mergibacter septicus]AWX13956.1 hypothetical protein CEP49_04985 [Mergibacter septicus]